MKKSVFIRLLTEKIRVVQRGLPTHSFRKKAVSIEGKTPKIKLCLKYDNTILVINSRQLK